MEGRSPSRFTNEDRTAYAAAEIATLKQKLTAVESRIRENAKSTPTLDDLRERMAALLRDPPTLDTAEAFGESGRTGENGCGATR